MKPKTISDDTKLREAELLETEGYIPMPLTVRIGRYLARHGLAAPSMNRVQKGGNDAVVRSCDSGEADEKGD